MPTPDRGDSQVAMPRPAAAAGPSVLAVWRCSCRRHEANICRHHEQAVHESKLPPLLLAAPSLPNMFQTPVTVFAARGSESPHRRRHARLFWRRHCRPRCRDWPRISSVAKSGKVAKLAYLCIFLRFWYASLCSIAAACSGCVGSCSNSVGRITRDRAGTVASVLSILDAQLMCRALWTGGVENRTRASLPSERTRMASPTRETRPRLVKIG